jgi:hypothetical protein
MNENVKRITALLQTLDEPYRSEALVNVDSEFILAHGFTSHSSNEQANAIYSSCSWVKTKQGHPYWLRLYYHLAEGTPTELVLKKHIMICATNYSAETAIKVGYASGALSEAAKDYWYEQFKNERDNQ